MDMTRAAVGHLFIIQCFILILQPSISGSVGTTAVDWCNAHGKPYCLHGATCSNTANGALCNCTRFCLGEKCDTYNPPSLTASNSSFPAISGQSTPSKPPGITAGSSTSLPVTISAQNSSLNKADKEWSSGGCSTLICVVIPVVSVAVLAAIIIGIVFCCKAAKKRQAEGRVTPTNISDV